MGFENLSVHGLEKILCHICTNHVHTLLKILNRHWASGLYILREKLLILRSYCGSLLTFINIVCHHVVLFCGKYNCKIHSKSIFADPSALSFSFHVSFHAKGCKINDHSKKIGPHVRTCVGLPGFCRYHKVTGSRVQLTVRVSRVLVSTWSYGGGKTILSKSRRCS